MKTSKKSMQSHHLYLGIGGMLAVATLVVALSFGLSGAQFDGPPPGGGMPPPGGDMGAPPPGGGMPPPGGDMGAPPPGGGMPPPGGDTGTPPPGGGMPPPGGTPPGGTYQPGQPGTYQPGQPGTYQPGQPGTQPGTTPGTQPGTTPGTQPGTQPGQTGTVTCPALNNRQVSSQECATATPVCGPGQTPSAQTPCRPSSTTQPGTTQPGQSMTVCAPGQTPTAQVPCRMDQPMQDTTRNQNQSMPVCGPTVTGPCRPAAGDQAQSTPMPPTMPPTMLPIPAATQMLQCTIDGQQRYMMPNFFDAETGAQRNMTCEDWTAQFQRDRERMQQDRASGRTQMPFMRNPMSTPAQGMPGTPGMPGTQGMPGMPPNTAASFDCSRDYNNPFCQSGNMGNTMFDQFNNQMQNVDTSNVRLGRNLEREIRRIKQEAVVQDKNNPTECGSQQGPMQFSMGRPRECDLVDVKRQLNEDTLKAGVSCPVASQIQSIVSQAESVFDEIRALSATATEEQVKAAMAKFDTLRGGPNGDGVLSQLFGGWDQANNRPKPGLIQSLDSCKQVGRIMRDATRELKNFKHLQDSTEYRELEDFANNPLAFLPAGTDIFVPFEPDWEVCGRWMGGPMGGGPQGPMGGPQGPMDGGSAMGGGGGPMDFQPMENFGPGGPEGFGFNSVLGSTRSVAQNGPRQGQGDRGGRPMGPNMGGGCGFFEPPADMVPPVECMPPVERHLGMPYGKMKDLIKALAEKSCTFESASEGDMACEGFAEAPEKLRTEGARLPLAVREKAEAIVAKGREVCQAGNSGKAKDLFRNLMGLVMPFMKEKMNVVKTEDDFMDNLKDRNNLENDEVDMLRREIASLKDELAAMNQKYLDLLSETVKLANALGDGAKEKLISLNITKEQIARLTSNEATASLGRELSERNQKLMAYANEVAPEISEEAQEVLAEVVELTLAGVSSSAEDDISEEFDALSAVVNSGALDEDEEVEAVEEFRDTVVEILNSSSEKDKQFEEGVIAFKDTPANHWASSYAQIATVNELASRANENVGVGNQETYNQAVVRVVRLIAKADDEMADKLERALEEGVDVELTRDLPGVASWAKPFLAVCQEAGVADCLNPPVQTLVQPIEREEMASLVVHALDEAGFDLPDGSDVDVTGVSPEYIDEVKIAKELGIMGGRTGPDDVDFGGSQELNVGMDLVIAVKTNELIEMMNSDIEVLSSDSIEVNPIPTPGPGSSNLEDEEILNENAFTDGEEG